MVRRGEHQLHYGKIPLFPNLPLQWTKMQQSTLWGGTAVVDGGKFADLAVSSWLHGRGIGKRGEERVRIQLHCEKWQNPDRNKYSPQKGDRMRRRKSKAAMALCAVVITMVCCGSLKSAGVSGGDV